MITLDNTSLIFGDKVLVKDASAFFGNGKLTALIGRNGSGKSTLLRALASLATFTCGKAYLDGTDSSSMTSLQRAKSLAFVSTEKVRIPDLTCRDLVSLGRAPYTNWLGKMQKEDEEIVMHSLELVGMQDFALRTLDTMSDGECQRVMIARALAQDTSNILLDEPTSFLDIPNRWRLCELLADLAHNQGKCIIFSTHEIETALKVCDSVALIDSPSLIYTSTQGFLSGGYMKRVFDIDV